MAPAPPPMASPTFLVCLAHFCEVHGPCCVICTSHAAALPADPEHASALPSCASCLLVLPDHKSQLVSDDARDRVFVSAAAPPPQCARPVASLAVASLLVESSLHNNPTFHGNPRDGYCIHRVFRLGDTTARGQERKYALLVVCDREADLLANWLLIADYFAQIVALISACVAAAAARVSGLILAEPYLRRLANRPRLLADLTNDPLIFAKLHLLHQGLLEDLLE